MAKASKDLQLLFDSRKIPPQVKFPRSLKTFFKRFAQKNFRPFPWRNRRASSYELLLAEILLKQTRAEDVVPIWSSLIRKYRDPVSLSKARVPELERLLKPLGLHHQRAIALKEIGKAAVKDFGRKIPPRTEQLLSVPHVGLYAACVITCFKIGKRVPIVDANVLRVFKRITGVDFGRDLRRNRQAWSLAWAILPKRGAALHNYGLLDFTGLVCTPTNPRCQACPLQKECAYGRGRLGVG